MHRLTWAIINSNQLLHSETPVVDALLPGQHAETQQLNPKNSRRF